MDLSEQALLAKSPPIVQPEIYIPRPYTPKEHPRAQEMEAYRAIKALHE